jgi:hypothetical protein
MANTGREVLAVDTAHGVYDVMPARDSDDAPGMATHAVFYEDGAVAGYASEDGTAWDASGTPFAHAGSLAAAAQEVAESDRDAVYMAYPHLFGDEDEEYDHSRAKEDARNAYLSE